MVPWWRQPFGRAPPGGRSRDGGAQGSLALLAVGLDLPVAILHAGGDHAAAFPFGISKEPGQEEGVMLAPLTLALSRTFHSFERLLDGSPSLVSSARRTSAGRAGRSESL